MVAIVDVVQDRQAVGSAAGIIDVDRAGNGDRTVGAVDQNGIVAGTPVDGDPADRCHRDGFRAFAELVKFEHAVSDR